MPRPPIQHHKLIIELPDGLLGKFDAITVPEGIPKARITGAAIAAAGTYMGMHILVTFGQNVAGAAQSAFKGPIPTGGQPGLAAVNFFIQIFQGGGEAAAFLTAPVEWTEFDPYAFSTALIVGGMILAGLNPGEVLLGFGKIIDGIVPF